VVSVALYGSEQSIEVNVSAAFVIRILDASSAAAEIVEASTGETKRKGECLERRVAPRYVKGIEPFQENRATRFDARHLFGFSDGDLSDSPPPIWLDERDFSRSYPLCIAAAHLPPRERVGSAASRAIALC
jgi:hypothetical protein